MPKAVSLAPQLSKTCLKIIFLPKLSQPYQVVNRSAKRNDATMVTKSKLKMALAAEKGTDFGKQHLKKKEKAARKGKSSKSGEEQEQTTGKKAEEEWEDVQDETELGDEEEEDEESGSEAEIGNSLQVCHPTDC
jgi:hypothetical protein